jgi:FtsP/CotA-like multicopper oxidase with cupredoxin domain
VIKKFCISVFTLLAFVANSQVNPDVMLISKIDLAPQYPMWDNTPTQLMGYTRLIGQPIVLPSPTLEFTEGDTVDIGMWNLSQGPPHTIHLHGLDVDQQNDGVPHLSFDVPHDDTGFYHMVVPHPGTYLYHCHVVSTIHVQAGMYGMLIVRPVSGNNVTWDNGGYNYDKEFAWLTSELDTVWHHDSIINHPHDTTQTVHHIPHFAPQYFLINGKSETQLNDPSIKVDLSVNETGYMRLANIGYCGNRIVFPSELDVQIVSSDGRPLPMVGTSDTLEVYPGERYGVLISSTAEFTDSISVEYLDMNTGLVKNIQRVSINVRGYFSINEEEEILQFNAFPNPASDLLEIAIQMRKPTKASIILTDIHGKVILEMNRKLNNENLIINTETIAAGMYVLHINTEKQHLSKKIIVQH